MLRSFLVSLGLASVVVPASFLGACVVESQPGPAGSSSSSGGGSGSSSGIGVGSSSGSSGGSSGSSSSGGVCMALSTVPSGDVPAYVPVVQVLNACSQSQIAAFVSACIDSTTQTDCMSFQSNMTNAGCMACLAPVDSSGDPTNAGGMLLDAAGDAFIASNLPGCVAIQDKTGGAACAGALEPYLQCTAYACASCTSETDYENCTTTATEPDGEGACVSENNQANGACSADFTDAGVANTVCATDTTTIDVICGSGTGLGSDGG